MEEAIFFHDLDSIGFESEDSVEQLRVAEFQDA